MSYRKRHIKEKVHRIKPKRLIIFKPVFWYVVLFIVLVSAGTYFFLFSSYFQVKNIIISGNQRTDMGELKTFIADHTDKKIINFYFLQVHSQSIFLINENHLEKEILGEFAGIGQAEVNKSYPQTIGIHVVERSPIGSFCSGANCFSMDISGVVFQASNSGEQGIIVRQTPENSNVVPGDKVLSQDEAFDIYSIQKLLQDDFQVGVREALVVDSQQLNITTSENWQVYFSLDKDDDMTAQLVKLHALLSGGLSDTSRKNLIYIDLRPKDRAIVCDNSVCAGNL